VTCRNGRQSGIGEGKIAQGLARHGNCRNVRRWPLCPRLYQRLFRSASRPPVSPPSEFPGPSARPAESVETFDFLQKSPQSCLLRRVAVHHFVGQWKTLRRDHQCHHSCLQSGRHLGCNPRLAFRFSPLPSKGLPRVGTSSTLGRSHMSEQRKPTIDERLEALVQTSRSLPKCSAKTITKSRSSRG